MFGGGANYLAIRIYVIVITILLGVFFVFSGVYLGFSLGKKADGFNGDYPVSSNAYVVGEIMSGSGFNLANLKTFFNTLSNSSSGSIDKIEANIGNGFVKANEIRGYSVGDKSAGKSLVVTIGGFLWTVVYLSKTKSTRDSNNDGAGDVIATLWLSDATKTSTFCNSSVNYGSANFDGCPTALYGSSYIRAVTLNQGGAYLNVIDNSSIYSSTNATASKDTNHLYKEFTIAGGKVTPYIVTPEYVSWQESGQSAKDMAGWWFNSSNDNWSTTVSNDGFYSNECNFATKPHSSIWKDDTLWLPSGAETGYMGDNHGIWGLNSAERSNSLTSCWLRSANDRSPRDVYALGADGASYVSGTVHYKYAIMPAFHLNLSLIAESMKLSIALNKQNGTSNETIKVCALSDLPNVSIPLKAGYVFDGYYSAINGGGVQYYLANGQGAINYPLTGGATTLYAKWVTASYVVRFNANGGAGAMNDLKIQFGASVSLTTNVFTRAGYVFGGWSYDPNSSEIAFVNGATVFNLSNIHGSVINLYAIWNSASYYVKYNGNGHTAGNMPNSAHVFGLVQALSANAYSKVGYTFLGWTTSAGGAVVYTDKEGVVDLATNTNDVFNLYAVWGNLLQFTISGSTESAEIITSYDANKGNAVFAVLPAVENYVTQISFDNKTFFEIDAYSKDLSGFDFALKFDWTVNKGSNAMIANIYQIFDDYLDENTYINIYLVTSTRDYSFLKDEIDSVVGVAVSSTYGGIVAVLGDNFGEVPAEDDEITLRATVALENYQFFGWCYANNLSEPFSSEASVRVIKREVVGRQIIAVFKYVEPRDDINVEVDN